MAHASEDAPPTWFRLSDESWAEIRREYRNGATARELAAKWRVSATTIYRRACDGGWSKKANGDAVARANAEAVAAEEKADRDWTPPHLADEAAADEGPVDVAAAVREALEKAGRALKAGRIAEADRLAGVAWSIGKMLEHPAFQPPPVQGVQLAPDEVVVTLEEMTELCETLAFRIVSREDLASLPAVIVHRAAMWRALVLGSEQEAEDKASAEAGRWADRIWSPDGEFYAPPTHERLARFVWASSRDDGKGVDLPRMSQLPPG